MAGIDRPGGKAGDRDKALETALAQIERQFGRGSVMRLGDEARAPIEVIPTGAISLDIALGIGGFPRGRVVEIYGPEGSGKALALDTPMPTPKGWTTMGELSPGQEVFAGDGSVTRVIFATPVMTGHECFRVRFSDGAEVIADADHQWVTTTLRGRTEGWSPAVVTTRDMGATLRAQDGHALNHAIEACGPLEYPAQELPVSPYTLGAWLGDGATDGASVTCADPEILRSAGSVHTQLRELGVLGNKHIPERYLHASVAQRLALLQGLMDTDGTVSTGGAGTGRDSGAARCEFSVVNERLAKDVHELLLGLGLKVTLREGPAVPPGRVTGTRYRLGFQTDLPVFRLPRKAMRLAPLPARRAKLRYVTAVEPVASVPVRCIQVDHPSHTYLAGRECVPTHNTTVALHAAANAQKNGGIAAFIDAEHALDPEYAKRLGVDTDALLVSQPDTGEQALEIADMLIRSSAIDVIIIDSVAALVPRAEIEGEMGDSHVGLQARLMSQALRKLAGALNQTKTTAIFINQLREKVGVMFGCMSYSTRVTLADGTQEKIGKIVNQRMDVEVLSYDPETDRVVPRRILNWFNNGKAEQFLQFTVAKSGKNGPAQFAATENHLIRTPGGWRPAGELIPGDRVLVAEQQLLGAQQVQVILGSLMGDGALSPNPRGRSGTRFRMGHGAEQAAYLDWKMSLLDNIPHTRTSNAKGAVFADFTPLPELAELREIVYFGDGKKHLTWDYLKSLTPLALAVWYMDDGCSTVRSKGVQECTRGGTGRIEICAEAISPGSRDRLVSYLRDAYRLDVKLISRGARKISVLQFTTAASEEFQKLVAPYIHPSMDYKLLPRFRGRLAVRPEFAPATTRPVPAQVLDIHVKPRTRSMSRFDIEVEGSHCYFVDGVMVHNSPETTSGGRALKFYSSVRLDVRRIETLKDGTEAVGNRTKVKVVKNKCLAEGSRVFDPVTGITHRIEDIVERRLPVHTVSADKRGVLETREVVSWFDQGEQEVIGLRLRDGTELWLTPDHKVLTEHGWQAAGELAAGDRVARPRAYSGFGSSEPVPPEHARLLGYLIGDGHVGARTPVQFINVAQALHEDAARIVSELGCEAKPTSQDTGVAYSHRPGEKNGVLKLCRWAGIYGCLAPDKMIPPAFFAPDVSAEVVGNLIFGLFETDGYVSRERAGGLRVGFSTASEQLARQLHWLLLRWGIGSNVRRRDPHAQRGGLIKGRRITARHTAWEVRVSGIENVSEFARAIPMWGPRGRVLTGELSELDGRHRGSQRIYVADELVKPILGYLARRGVSPVEAAQLIGRQASPGASLKAVLGTPRMHRDRLRRLADALDDSFLDDILADQLWFSPIAQVLPARRCRTFDVEVEDLHNLVAEDVIVHNCAPPFKTAEFDILFGIGISREGGLIDLGVEQGIVRKSGAWYTYEGDQLGQGKENARNFLRDNPDLANEIEKKIKEKLGVGARVDAEADKAPAPGADAGLRVVPGTPPAAAAASGGRGVTRGAGGPGGAGPSPR